MRLLAQLIEQRLGVFQIGGVEALGEPAVDFGEHRARFVAFAFLVEQLRETHAKTTFDKTIFTCFGKG
jgi:hypothetical protein